MGIFVVRIALRRQRPEVRILSGAPLFVSRQFALLMPPTGRRNDAGRAVALHGAGSRLFPSSAPFCTHAIGLRPCSVGVNLGSARGLFAGTRFRLFLFPAPSHHSSLQFISLMFVLWFHSQTIWIVKRAQSYCCIKHLTGDIDLHFCVCLYALRHMAECYGLANTIAKRA